MKYPYYNPNLHLSVLLKAAFLSSKKADGIIKDYFRQLTGKKYILITNSCRTALYLSYKAIGQKGEIITSPLTCKVAIDPIEESENIPVYADVNTGDLNIKTDDISHRITDNTYAIQAIHLGGISCEMEPVNKIAGEHNLWVIEDCAQALGAKYQDKYTGAFGDIACFSLIKNAYGIGGGILATNHKEIFEKASQLNDEFRQTSKILTAYRTVRNAVETYRFLFFGKILYSLLMKIRGNKTSYGSVKQQLFKLPSLAKKISAIQVQRLNKLHRQRSEIGKSYYQKLRENGLFENCKYNPDNSSFTKFFVYHPKLNTQKTLKKLHNQGIEAMHLEHKTGSPYQEKLISDNKAQNESLHNYLKVHDSVVSLPLSEGFDKNDIQYITNNIE
jgi:dTDP-4-amino-4,6-dideoxygalactose transaminase